MGRAALHAMGSRETSQLIADDNHPDPRIWDNRKFAGTVFPGAHRLDSLNRAKRRSRWPKLHN